MYFNNYWKEIRKAQQTSWREFCKKVLPAEDAFRLSRWIKKHNSWTVSGEKALKEMMETHFLENAKDEPSEDTLYYAFTNLPIDEVHSRKKLK